MGKGRRNRKQTVSVEEDDLSGVEDVSSDGEDDSYEAELTDDETVPAESATIRRPYRKRARETSEKFPLMEVEGKSFRVLGFNQIQRAAFINNLMRFGTGECDWVESTEGLEQKTPDEIQNYGTLFMSHMTEDLTDSPIFSDGVPKEGLIVEEVLARIATLNLFRDKVKASSDRSTLFTDDTILRYPGLSGGRIWKELHDRLLLQAVLKYGYGSWQAIVDNDLKIQEVICQELNLPDINEPESGSSQAQGSATQTQSHPLGMSYVQTSASGLSQLHTGEHVEAPRHEAKASIDGNDHGDDVAFGDIDTSVHSQPLQDQSFYHVRELQRRQVEFIKKRVLLLEIGLQKELLQKIFYGDGKTSTVVNEESGHEVTDQKREGSTAQWNNHFSLIDLIPDDEIVPFANDANQDREVGSSDKKPAKLRVVRKSFRPGSFCATDSNPHSEGTKSDTI